jgi:hypothetical protein
MTIIISLLVRMLVRTLSANAFYLILYLLDVLLRHNEFLLEILDQRHLIYLKSHFL